MTKKLDISTPTDCEIRFLREFDAPRELVFDAYTKPELLKKWLFGPDGWELAVCEIDLKPGGRYRYVWRRADGFEMGMGGAYRDVKRPERVVFTEKFDESWYPGEAVGTLVLTERAGKTTASQTMRYESKDARDAVLKSPMEEGMALGFERLEKLVVSLKKR